MSVTDWANAINGRALGGVVKQRDLEVQVCHSLKFASHVDRVVKEAFSTLAFIAQTFECRSWKDIIKLERVHKNFTRMLPDMEGMSYKERLDRLGPTSLEHRRLRSDLIEPHKFMRDIDGAVHLTHASFQIDAFGSTFILDVTLN
eukprot:g33539.t1